MVKLNKILSLGWLFLPMVCFSQAHLGNLLSLEEAKKKWGEKPFMVKSFKDGNAKDKASMVVDLIKQKSYIGKDKDVIYKELGSGRGYFISDHIPAYILEVPKNKHTEPTWQLIFETDVNSKIAGLYIQENSSELDVGLFKVFVESLKKLIN